MGEGKALCLNERCKKSVPSDSNFCPYCGGQSISKVQAFGYQTPPADEITMENFQKVIEQSEPAPEPEPLKVFGKGSLKSRIVVRLQFIRRKLFSRRRR